MAPASPVPELATLIKLDNTLGTVFIGLVLSAILFGVSILQVYNYYNEFSDDVMLYRASVAILWILDAILLGITIHYVYYYLVHDFGNYQGLNSVVWSFKLMVLMNVIIVHYVISLYAYRLWKLNHEKLLWPRFAPIITLISFGAGLTLAAKVFQLSSFTDLARMGWVIDASLATLAVADFIIAGSMCFYLHKSKSEFQPTNSMISVLVLWTLGTGLTTSICSFAAITTFALMPHNLVFVGLEMLLGKLYFNSLLAMLNARKHIRARGIEKMTPNDVTTSINFFRPRDSAASDSRNPLPTYLNRDNKTSLSLGIISDRVYGYSTPNLVSSKPMLKPDGDILLPAFTIASFSNYIV